MTYLYPYDIFLFSTLVIHPSAVDLCPFELRGCVLPDTEKVFTLRGETIQVDTSAEACRRFGFDPDDQIASERLGLTGIVVGVAPTPLIKALMTGCREALWVRLELNRDLVTAFTDPSADFVKVLMVA
ncbi:hypothetical protein KJ782_06515 [Patescibacteria group bacterium]|nr:hypothetical protein [Patescibacteria group bacterium]